ncbi:unnamed protein product [Paramecium primaurelia]|uniref:Uncharacterized protein n=1 Tax=Paramecium primaurelia TaxID=5886 RepID=A0A8S1JWT9_PARPR|nr:unnamed protein product [Paramecium primaurelia]
MGCHIQTGRQVQSKNEPIPCFEQQLLEIDKREFFKNKKCFQIILKPILYSFSQEKGETDTSDQNS